MEKVIKYKSQVGLKEFDTKEECLKYERHCIENELGMELQLYDKEHKRIFPSLFPQFNMSMVWLPVSW